MTWCAVRKWALAALCAVPLAGCRGVLDPKGPVGASEKLILFDSLAVMLAIVIPTIVATFVFAWWFRAGNTRAHYRPDWAFSGRLELIVWSIPLLVITFLGGIAWFGAHALDPYRPLPSPQPPVEVQVVALEWKWLFIYPAEHIATTSQLVIPVGRPVHFTLTSSSVMNSFFIPQLGSQIYAMAAMTSQLNLQADQPGTYGGLSTMFSGADFAGMNFTVHAVQPGAYARWVAAARASGPVLDRDSYAILAKPGKTMVPVIYRATDPDLFRDIVTQAIPPAPGPLGTGGKDEPRGSTT